MTVQRSKPNCQTLRRYAEWQAGPETRQRWPSRCRSPSQEMVGPTSLTRPLRRLTKGCVQCIVFGQYDGRKGPRAELFMKMKYLYLATSMPWVRKTQPTVPLWWHRRLVTPVRWARKLSTGEAACAPVVTGVHPEYEFCVLRQLGQYVQLGLLCHLHGSLRWSSISIASAGATRRQGPGHARWTTMM